MTKRKAINQIRTDTLETKIAHYRAMGNYDAADAIESLARSIGAPIDMDAIAEEVKERHEVYFSQTV